MTAPVREEVENTLLPCSFRGVQFYWEGGSIVGGRKATEGPIVVSDEQIISDVGLRQRAYSIRGLIAVRTQVGEGGESTVAQTYADHRRTLLAALESSEPATFVHPIEGTVTGLVARSWSLDETFSELGIGRIGIEFIRDTTRPTPVIEIGAADLVAETAETARSTALAEFASKWNVDPSIVGAYEDGLAKTRDAFAAVQRSADEAQTVASQINGFASAISTATADAARLIQTPLVLANALAGVFDSLRSIYPTAAAAFDALALGFGYGGLDALPDADSPSSIARRLNVETMNASMNILFLSNAYEAASGLSFLTLDEIDRVDAVLGKQHDSLLDVVDAETVDALEELRAAFSDVLSAARLTAYRLTRENVSPTTPRALAFVLYGSDELADTLAALNGRYSYELLDGETTVLSS